MHNEEWFLRELKKGNEEALRDLYKTHYPMVLRLVLSNSGSEQEAKDVYQEAVIHFYERIRQPEFKLTCLVKTYLYAVSHRLWLKRLWEKKRIQGKIEDAETFLHVETEVEDLEQKEKHLHLMADALGVMGEPCQTLLKDFYFGNLSMEEIAEKFGYTNPENAKNQKYKCLQRLKRIFFNGQSKG